MHTGNREPKLEGEKEWPRQKEVKEGSNLHLAQKARRFMIYVHSKLLICDDEVRLFFGRSPHQICPYRSQHIIFIFLPPYSQAGTNFCQCSDWTLQGIEIVSLQGKEMSHHELLFCQSSRSGDLCEVSNLVCARLLHLSRITPPTRSKNLNGSHLKR